MSRARIDAVRRRRERALATQIEDYLRTISRRVNSMLVTFETKSYARVVFFADVAADLLRAMGKSGDIPGAILAADVPKALARLRSHVGDANAQSTPESAPDGADEDEPRVDLATRAFPLIELLSAAAENEDDVIWKQS